MKLELYPRLTPDGKSFYVTRDGQRVDEATGKKRLADGTAVLVEGAAVYIDKTTGSEIGKATMTEAGANTTTPASDARDEADRLVQAYEAIGMSAKEAAIAAARERNVPAADIDADALLSARRPR